MTQTIDREIIDIERNSMNLLKQKGTIIEILVSRIYNDKHPLSETPLGTFYSINLFTMDAKGQMYNNADGKVDRIHCIRERKRVVFGGVGRYDLREFTYNGVPCYGLIATVKLTEQGIRVWDLCKQNGKPPRFITSFYYSMKNRKVTYNGVKDFVMAKHEDYFEGLKINDIIK